MKGKNYSVGCFRILNGRQACKWAWVQWPRAENILFVSQRTGMWATASFYHSSNKYPLRNLSSRFFFRVLKSCLIIGGNRWTLGRSEILKDDLDVFARWLYRSVSKYSKALGLFHIKAGGELLSYNRIRFILTTNPDISSNRIMGVLSWIQWFPSNIMARSTIGSLSFWNLLVNFTSL